MEYVKQRHCVDCWQEGKVFDGFRAFKIDAETGIQEQWSIAHYYGDFLEDDVCYGYGYVAPRSLMFDDSPHDLITLKGHSVLVHNLTTIPINSATGVDLDADNTDCSGDYFYGADLIASWNPFV
jgi:hypothetical protein